MSGCRGPRPFAPWRREVMEHAESVPVRIRCGEFVQSPWLRVRVGQQNGVGCTPRAVQIIDLTFAVQIEPGRHGTGVAACFAECWAGEEEPTLITRDSRESDVHFNPVDAEAQPVAVVLRSRDDIRHRDFGHRARQFGNLSFTRFRGRLTRSNFGAEVAHESEGEGRAGRAA